MYSSVFQETFFVTNGIGQGQQSECEKTYEEFKKDNRTTPTAYALTNSKGVATFIFTYDEWFESSKDRFFTFAVQYGSGTENYEIWSSGRTIRSGSVTQIELKLKPL